MTTYGEALEKVILLSDVHGVGIKVKEGIKPVNLTDEYKEGSIYFSITGADGKENWFEYNTGKLIPV